MLAASCPHAHKHADEREDMRAANPLEKEAGQGHRANIEEEAKTARRNYGRLRMEAHTPADCCSRRDEPRGRTESTREIESRARSGTACPVLLMEEVECTEDEATEAGKKRVVS
eukprot:1302704-Pleurochrysis_carterae.AAC.1